MTPGYQFSKVTVIRQAVVQPHSVGFVKTKLDHPIEDPYIVESCPSKDVVSSRVYADGQHVTLKVINDSDFFVTYKKGKTVGHAEYGTFVKENENNFTSDQTEPGRAHVYQCKNDTYRAKHRIHRQTRGVKICLPMYRRCIQKIFRDF